jgi:hypothetical protein
VRAIVLKSVKRPFPSVVILAGALAVAALAWRRRVRPGAEWPAAVADPAELWAVGVLSDREYVWALRHEPRRR